MGRIFLTGAFRKPRELNWTHRHHHADPGHPRGLHRLLAARRPDLGHRPAHRLLHRRVDPARRQLPGLVPVGRAVPGQRHHHPALLHHPRADHPAGPDRAALGAPRPAGPPEAHAVPGRGAHRAQRGGLAHVPDLHGQDHRLPLHGDRRRRRCSVPSPRSTRSGSSAPTTPSKISYAVQPDWYMGWLDGALRIMPSWELDRLRPHRPPRGLPARRGLPRPHLHHLPRCGRRSNAG